MTTAPIDAPVTRLFELGGRVALVTGGSRGLGLQIAHTLGGLGARVFVAARRRAKLDEAVTKLEAEGIRADGVVSDLSDPAAPEALVREVIGAGGALDILVNAAGTAWGAPALEHSLDAWEKVLRLNLTATFLCAQAAARHAMVPRGWGRIVNVASVAGLKAPHPDHMAAAAYNASKGGVVSLTRALAVEWARHGITVNALAPGFFPTRMSRAMLAHEPDAKLAAVPLARFGGDDDLRGVAALLASQAGGYMTGQVIAVDGGMTAW